MSSASRASAFAVVVLACTLTTNFGRPARADYLESCCGDRVRWFRDATFKLLNQGYFQPGQPARLRFQEAVNRYNEIPGSWFDWAVVQDDDNVVTEEGDGTEAGFMAANAPDCGLLGRSFPRWGVCGWPFCDEEIYEADIKFYLTDCDGTPYAWDFGVPPSSYFQSWSDDPGQDMQGGAPLVPLYFAVVAAHEIGHSTGLEHTTAVHSSGAASRMGALYPNGGWFHAGNQKVGPLAYDCDQVRGLYPTSGSAADVYATSFRGRPSPSTTGPVTADGTSSTSLSARFKYPYNLSADRTASNDDLTVFPGDIVRAQVCVGNLGNASTGALSLDFYLSLDQAITTSDRRSPSNWNHTFLGSGYADCDFYDFAVPSGVTRNQFYYVGAWLNRGTSTTANTDNVTVLNRRLLVGNYP